eukprot:315554-Chlamydomonas_euryale.AAC.1
MSLRHVDRSSAQQCAMRWAAMQGNGTGPGVSMGMGDGGGMGGGGMGAIAGMGGGGMGAMAGMGGGGMGQGMYGRGDGGGGDASGDPHKGIYWKTRVCHKWQAGSCPLDVQKCRYAHGDSDLRTPAVRGGWGEV